MLSWSLSHTARVPQSGSRTQFTMGSPSAVQICGSIAPTRPPLAVHEAGLAERGDELLEVCLGQVLARGDGVQRHGPLAPVLCEIDHETHPVFAARGDVEGGG